MQTKFRAGIIGCGRIAWQWDRPGKSTYNTHAKAYADHSAIELVACADPVFSNAKGLATRYAPVTPYADYTEMLLSETLDVVSICTPAALHYEVLRFILLHTPIQYIFAEKPLTTSLEQTQTIYRLARKNGVYIALNYYRRFDETLQRVQQVIADRTLGNLCFGRVLYYGGIKENAIHLLDLLEYFGFTIHGMTAKRELSLLHDDQGGTFVVCTKKGATIDFKWFEKKQYGYLEMDLFFDTGRIRIGDYSETEIFVAAPSKNFPGYHDLQVGHTYPSTVCTVMKYAVSDLIQRMKTHTIDYHFLERELRLMKHIHKMIS